jgi:c-di-GMP-binding flagellar brake protein YcgR
MFRSGAEIGPVLRTLIEERTAIVCYLRAGETAFESRLRHVDPAGQFIIIDAGENGEALSLLVSMPRCIFHSDVQGWHVEFVSIEPQAVRLAGKPAIRLRFPEIMSRWRRTHPRASVTPSIPLQCVADSEGIMPFEGLIVDIGPEGLGFLIHAANITLEPGTLLKSCLIEVPGKPTCKVDLEVCYSQPVVLGDGTRSLRSGCRFLETTGSAQEVIRFYMGNE